MEDSHLLNEFIQAFANLPGDKILVHGGGNIATDVLEKLGIASRKVDGRRITCDAAIEIITMVFSGLNKKITARLCASGVKAIGLCGADMLSIPASKRPVTEVDYGWVGDILPKGIKTDFIHRLLKNGIVPVFSSLTCDEKGNLLNTNADSLAMELAVAMSGDYEVRLIFTMDKSGLLHNISDESSLISRIPVKQIPELISAGVISGGMIPKVSAIQNSLQSGVKEVVLLHHNQLENLITNFAQTGTHVYN